MIVHVSILLKTAGAGSGAGRWNPRRSKSKQYQFNITINESKKFVMRLEQIKKYMWPEATYGRSVKILYTKLFFLNSKNLSSTKYRGTFGSWGLVAARFFRSCDQSLIDQVLFLQKGKKIFNIVKTNTFIPNKS